MSCVHDKVKIGIRRGKKKGEKVAWIMVWWKRVKLAERNWEFGAFFKALRWFLKIE